MTVYIPEVDQSTALRAWWTDNDETCDFCITGDTDEGPSFNLSYLEAKYLYDVLHTKLHGRTMHNAKTPVS